MRDHQLEETRLIERLHIGSKPPTGRYVAENGFGVLVLCAQEYQPRRRKFPGVKVVLHAPLDDARPAAEEIDTALTAAMYAADYHHDGERILVTCIQGRNRSGLVAAMALHLITCCEPSECVRFIQSKRVGPDGGIALSNHWFVDVVTGLRIAC